MKVLLISGRGRQDGNTSRALGIFRERLERASGDAGVVLEVEPSITARRAFPPAGVAVRALITARNAAH